MNRRALVAIAVAGALAVGGAGAAVALVVQKSVTGQDKVFAEDDFEGGKGGDSAVGGPQPGDDYPADLKNRAQDSKFDQFGEYNRECVSFVAVALFQRFGYKLPWRGGNATDWGSLAKSHGIAVDQNATVNSVAWRKSGHVALVVGVSGDLVTVEQYNRHRNGTYSWEITPKSAFDGYLHFLPDAAPAPAPPPPAPVQSAPAPTLTVVTQPQGGGQLQVANPQGGNTNPQGTTGNPQAGGTNPQGGGGVSVAPVQTSSVAAPPPTNPPPPVQPAPPPTYAETVGGPTHTWTNFSNAGGAEGPLIPTGTTVQIACKVTGFRVADGNTWWYRIASSPWNGTYYASADAFYNNGRTSGSLVGTPFVDPAVRNC